MIIELTRGHITVKVGDKIAIVLGEILSGSINFVVYENSIQNWEPPHDQNPISEAEKEEIIATLKKDAKETNLKIEIE